MNPIDIVCLILILVGVFFIVRSLAHRHKGMWDMSSDYIEPWDSANSELPRHRRSGSRTPYDEMQFGVGFVALGVLFAIQQVFGWKAFAIGVITVCAVNLAYSVIRLSIYDEDDEQIRAFRTANIIVSIFIGLVGVFLLVML